MAPCLLDIVGEIGIKKNTTSREMVETLFCTQTQQEIASVSPNPPKCHHTSTPIAPVTQPTSKLQMSRQVNSLPPFSLFLIIGV